MPVRESPGSLTGKTHPECGLQYPQAGEIVLNTSIQICPDLDAMGAVSSLLLLVDHTLKLRDKPTRSPLNYSQGDRYQPAGESSLTE